VKRRMPGRRIAACAVLLVLAAGCGSEEEADGAQDTSGLDGSWVLTSGTYDGAPLGLDDTHPITLELDGDHVGGTSGCNHYGGEMEVDGDTVSFGALGGTEMACMPASVMDLEQRYLSAMAAVDTAAHDGDALRLTGPGVTLTYETVPPVPRADLVGTSWRLESLVEGDAVSSVASEPATLLLSEDGNVTGSTGCRDFQAGWERAGAGVVLDTLVVDDNACPGPLKAQDEHVLGVLGDAFTTEIEGAVLTVTGRVGDGLVYRTQ